MLKTLPTNPFRDFVSILLRALHAHSRSKGSENIEKAGPRADHRAQPRQLPRRSGRAVASPSRSRCSRSTTSIAQALVGEAVPAS